MQPDETGRLTYEAYVRAKDGSDHAAGKIRWRPRWEWLVPEEQDAWRQAAVNDGERVTILRTDLEALLALAAWAGREHGDTLPEALLLPAGDVLARYDVHLETT